MTTENTELIHETNNRNYVPVKLDTYIPWGNYKDIESIVKSKVFYPTYITGLSGNGKTMGIMQACANLKRECIRVNLTVETDEEDLLGGFRLVNGDTVWQDGPVVEAMKRGAVLLLDEIDLASHKIMCLQPILEGNGVYLKKINQQVKHASGFTIFATANTKGKGSEDGNFIGTNMLNEAFLDRFPATIYQDYPPMDIEKQILLASADADVESLNIPDEELTEDKTFEITRLISNSLSWAEQIRQSHKEGVDGLDSVITTRRLVDLIRTYLIFGSEEKALNIILERFDGETRESFMEMYRAVAKPTKKSN